MAALLRMFESCLLLGMGSFMAMLSQSDLYWQFLNPKYSWLTLVSGVVLMLIGFFSILNTQRQRKISELTGLMIFLGIAGTALSSSSYLEMTEAELSEGSSMTMEYATEAPVTIEFDGREYMKINVAELLQQEQLGLATSGQAYALQGTVVRTAELDKAGLIGVGRLFVACCFADSTAVLSLVKVPNPNDYTADKWVQVFGILTEEKTLTDASISIRGALSSARSERFVLKAKAIQESRVQGLPFIFEIRENAPFAY